MATAGFSFLYKHEKPNLSQKSDCLVLLCHWALLEQEFKAVGLENKTERNDLEEDLPDDWSKESGSYSIIYKRGSDKFLFRAANVEDILMIHLNKLDTEVLSDCQLKVYEHVTGDLQTARSAFGAGLQSLYDRIQRDVVKPVLSSSSAKSSKSPGKRSPSPARKEIPEKRDTNYDRLRAGPNRYPPRPDPFAVGGHDLDPFGARGGGMFMDPSGLGRAPLRGGWGPGGGRLPPGAVPPGARFDEFGPPGTGPSRGFGPDPDHLRRPDDYDDMFS